MVVAVVESGQLSEIAPVIDSGLVAWWEMLSESGRSHCLRALLSSSGTRVTIKAY